jgi:hypothetical protein
MSRYLYDLPDWPDFRWDREKLAAPLVALRHRLQIEQRYDQLHRRIAAVGHVPVHTRPQLFQAPAPAAGYVS